MKWLSQVMNEAQIVVYISGSYWTIRRSHKFWCSIFTNQTIEQTLMRILKTKGCIVYDQIIIISTRSKMVCILPQTIPMCAPFESFRDTRISNTDQRTGLKPTATATDGEHFIKFKSRLSTHSPFFPNGEYAKRFHRSCSSFSCQCGQCVSPWWGSCSKADRHELCWR